MSEPEASPPLETGWLSTTPVSDSYLRRFLWNWADACAATADGFDGYVVDTEAVRLADAGRPGSFSNCATLTQPLTAERVDSTLAQVTAFLASRTRHGPGRCCSSQPGPPGISVPTAGT